MRNLGRVKSSRTNLLAFAGLAAMLITTACGSGPTGPTGPTGPNQAPEAFGWAIEDLRIDTGQSKTLNMGDIFNDPDGDALTYKAESSHNTIATVYVSGSTAFSRAALTVVGVNSGVTPVTVTATDPEGLSARMSFSAWVNDYFGACSVGMELWPYEACSVGSNRFVVGPKGGARFGSRGVYIYRLRVGQFSASKIARSDAWRIDSVP
ncbi:MAG: hypothetical protein F4Y61_06930 [Rhodothermaceae bacterium]|nr:hypothetical protein [Rhodothermaceae bacterium]